MAAFANVSDAVWLAAIGVVMVAVTEFFNRLRQRAVDARLDAKERRDAERSGTNVAKLDEMARVGEATHTLVNSNMGTQLKLNAIVSRRLADETGNPSDVAAAELAEKLYKEHQAKQAVVDSKGAVP